MAARFMMRDEVVHPEHIAGPNVWRLWLQWGDYVHDHRAIENGYRFIWRRPNGSLQAARGQARIPSLADAELLIRLAREAGWGDRVGG